MFKSKKCQTAVLLVGVLVFVFLFSACGGKTTAAELLLQGNDIAAFEEYVKSYGLGNSDDELEAAVLLRLREIKNGIADGSVSYEDAMDTLDVLSDMRIADLEEDIEDVKKTAEGSLTADTVQENPTEAATTETATEAPTAAPVITTTYASAQPSGQNLQSEPLPAISVSTTPRIISASTVRGNVLESSNVNAARSFGANKAIDGYYDSCWCVTTSRSGGAGASIRFQLAETSVVSGVMLVNGNLYLPYEGIYRSNGQVRGFTLTFSDGSSKSFTASYNGSASSAYQYFNFGTPVTTDSITLTVDSAYVGEKYTENVCIGEFGVY